MFSGLCACHQLNVFASSSQDGTVQIWDKENRLLRSGQELLFVISIFQIYFHALLNNLNIHFPGVCFNEEVQPNLS